METTLSSSPPLKSKSKILARILITTALAAATVLVVTLSLTPESKRPTAADETFEARGTGDFDFPLADEGKLSMDHAVILVKNNMTDDVTILYQATACLGCPPEFFAIASGTARDLKPNSSPSSSSLSSSSPLSTIPTPGRETPPVLIKTVWSYNFVIQGAEAVEGDVGADGKGSHESVTATKPNKTLDKIFYSFYEGGRYEMTINDVGVCGINVKTQPPTPYLPILYAFLFALGIYLVERFLRWMYEQLGTIDWQRSCRSCVLILRSGDEAKLKSADENSPSPTTDGGNKHPTATDGDDSTATAKKGDDNPAASTADVEMVLRGDDRVKANTDDSQSPKKNGGTNVVIVQASDAEAAKKEERDGTEKRDDGKTQAVEDKAPSSTTAAKPARKRLLSLDTFRGLSITLMIFVNYRGGGYYFFDHAPWDGLHLADFVFPWFVWIMGVSLAFGMKRHIKSKGRRAVAIDVAIRSAKLFFLGLFLNTAYGMNDLRFIRVPGVLQRFAASYGSIAGLGILLLDRSDDDKDAARKSKWRLRFADILATWKLWIANIVIVILYLSVTNGLAVPGCETGYLGPGGNHDGGRHFNCTGGAAGYIDRMFYGGNHIYHNPTPKELYKTDEPFDPEGLLGNLTSVFLTFLGFVAGSVFVFFSDYKGRLIRLTAWGSATCLLSLILCQFSMSGGWNPINKNLWSLSFVLLAGGLAFLVIALCYFVIDVKGFWWGTPLREAGMNSITLYVGHQVLADYFPIRWASSETHLNLMIYSVWGTFIWLSIAELMYHSKVFITI